MRNKTIRVFAMIVIICITMMPKYNGTSVDAAIVIDPGSTGDGRNSLSVSKARVGDIILTRGNYFIDVDDLIPGKWSHCLIYVGYSFHFNHERGYWHWDYYVLHSYPVLGVIYSTWDFAVKYNDEACIVRVSGSYATTAVIFMKCQYLKSYDYKLVVKQVFGYKYYCSELAWAGYKFAGVDIDRNPGWSSKYAFGVAPQEIYDDGNTYLIAHSY